MSKKEPIFNIAEPSIVTYLVILAVIHAVQLIPSIGDLLFQYNVLVPMEAIYSDVTPLRQAWSLLGHGFLHGDLNHLMMNSASILIFGIITFRGVRALYGYGSKGTSRFWMLFFLGVIGGGIAQWGWWSAINAGEVFAVGASGGASALFASAGWTIGGRDRLILFGLAYVVLNIVLVMASGSIAWAAHAGGFVMGALLSVYWVKPFSAGTSIFR